MDADCLRHLKPKFPCRHDCACLGGTDSGGKRTHGPVGYGMGIRPYVNLSRFCRSAFQHELMADSLHVMQLCPVILTEFYIFLNLLRVDPRTRRRKMVNKYMYMLRIFHPEPVIPEDIISHCACRVLNDHILDFGGHDLPRLHLFSARGMCKDFFRYRHAHNNSS